MYYIWSIDLCGARTLALRYVDQRSLGASSPLCYKQLGRGWVHQNTTVLFLIIIMLTTTCFDHCGPSSVHKMYKGGELYSVYSLVEVHILNFQRIEVQIY